jgi:uncharacterized repeat protein (TIGR03803 family)
MSAIASSCPGIQAPPFVACGNSAERFDGTDGQSPSAALVQGTDGNFYGTTPAGGTHLQGSVFKIDSAGNLTTLHSFSGFPLDGAAPTAGPVQGADGNFYGTTASGRMHYQGTVFNLESTGNLTTLHSLAVLRTREPLQSPGWCKAAMAISMARLQQAGRTIGHRLQPFANDRSGALEIPSGGNVFVPA